MKINKSLMVLGTVASIFSMASYAQAAIIANAITNNAITANAITNNAITNQGAFVSAQTMPAHTGMMLRSAEFQSIQVEGGKLVGISH